MGIIITRMGKEMADAIRAVLGRMLVEKYGDLQAAAAEMGIPYKTRKRR